MSNYFLWPHRDETKLRSLLQRGIVDLSQRTPGFRKMQEGDRVYLCVPKGRFIASATLASSPYRSTNPERPEFPMVVNLKEVKLIERPIVTGRSPRGVTLLPGPLVEP